MSTGLSFQLSDDQLEIQEVTRKFTKEEIIPVASHHDRTGEYPWDLIRKAWGLGLLNCHIPAEFGGMDLSCVTDCLISEELSFGCTGINAAMKVSEIGVSPNKVCRLSSSNYLKFYSKCQLF